MATLKHSWILPVFNEAQSLPQLLSEINQAMKGKSFEIIAIDDASQDTSLKTLTSLTTQIPQMRILSLKTRQGKWAALASGFKLAKGSIIITLDSDLQDDPQEAQKLIQKLQSGYDLVSGWRKVRLDPFYKVVISRLGNWLVSILIGYHFKDLNSPFKAFKKQVLDSIPTEGSLLRFSLLFAKKLGYKVLEVPITHRPRIYGNSKFGLVKYLRIIYDLILVMLLFSGSGRLRNKK